MSDGKRGSRAFTLKENQMNFLKDIDEENQIKEAEEAEEQSVQNTSSTSSLQTNTEDTRSEATRETDVVADKEKGAKNKEFVIGYYSFL